MASKPKAKPEVPLAFQSMDGGPGVKVASDGEVRLVVPIDSVVQDPKNARERTPRNVKSTQASLKEFGQQKPIVVDADGIIRAGNGTHAAAKALGWSMIWITRSTLEGDKVRAYAVADNRTTDLSQFDETALVATLGDLSPELLAATGFDQAEVDEMLPSGQLEDGKPDDSRKGLGKSTEGRIVVRPMLALATVAKFEAALTRTRIPNREKAIEHVMDFFLDHNPEGS